jgi:hypothetical protein
MDNRKLIFTLIAAVVALMASPAWASYAIYVGKNSTSDGSVFIGGTGDEPSSHWLEIVPRKNHTAGETISVGVTKEANYPGESIQIPQVPVTAKYITMNYSEYLMTSIGRARPMDSKGCRTLPFGPNPDTANYVTEDRWAIIVPVPAVCLLMPCRCQ